MSERISAQQCSGIPHDAATAAGFDHPLPQVVLYKANTHTALK